MAGAWTFAQFSDNQNPHWQQSFQNDSFDVMSLSFASPARKDSPNEDAIGLLFHEQTGYLLLADGLGGQRGGAEASQKLMEAFGRPPPFSPTKASSRELRNFLLDNLEETNEKILSWALGSGTTFAGGYIQGNNFRPFFVGDSLIFVVGQKGKLKYQSTAHSPVGYALDLGLLDESQALAHEESHILLNSLGAPDSFVQMDSPVSLSPLDTLLICSDGLTDNLRPSEIAEIIRKGSLEEASLSLFQVTQDRISSPEGKEDDLSVILLRLRSEGANVSET